MGQETIQKALFRVYLDDEYKKLYEAGRAEANGNWSTLTIRADRDGGGEASIKLGLLDTNLEAATTLQVANLIAYFATQGKTLDDILSNIQWGIQDTPENIRKRAEPEVRNALTRIAIKRENGDAESMHELGPLITKYGEPVVELIYEWIQNQTIQEGESIEAVVVVGNSFWPLTDAYRASFLTRCLEAPYSEVRRAAAQYLSKDCLPALQKAHEKETDGFVKASIGRIIANLQEK